jgi:diaminopimelate epimerase
VLFHKMHGLGNDFIVLDNRDQSINLATINYPAMAERNHGFGCDQVLILESASAPDHLAAFRVVNADGSDAQQCGNGVRCLAIYLKMQNVAPAGPFQLQGPAGTVVLELLNNDCVKVNMGVPVFEPSQIPLSFAVEQARYEIDHKQGKLQFAAVSIGNPHAVVLCSENYEPNPEVGRFLRQHPIFPDGCNSGFVTQIDYNLIRLIVYERGSGTTQACGSGACAAGCDAQVRPGGRSGQG